MIKLVNLSFQLHLIFLTIFFIVANVIFTFTTTGDLQIDAKKEVTQHIKAISIDETMKDNISVVNQNGSIVEINRIKGPDSSFSPILKLGPIISEINLKYMNQVNHTSYVNLDLLQDRLTLIKKINVSGLDNLNLGVDNPLRTFYLKFSSVLDEIIVVDNNDNFGNIDLLRLNTSNLHNYTKDPLSGNNVLDIHGFKLNDQNGIIYAMGEHNYFAGDPYEIRFGLAESFHNHSIFAINPLTLKIMKVSNLWGGEMEEDETSIGGLFINNIKNELYVVTLDDGYISDILILDMPTLQVKSKHVIPDYFNGDLKNIISYDNINNLFFLCGSSSFVGINPDGLDIIKNISSLFCPENIDSSSQIGYFKNYDEDYNGFISLENGSIPLILKNGNITDIQLIKIYDGDQYMYNQTALIVAHSGKAPGDSCSPESVDKAKVKSYLIIMNILHGTIHAVYIYDGIYIDKIIQNPDNQNSYALAIQDISSPYACYQYTILYDLNTTIREDKQN